MLRHDINGLQWLPKYAPHCYSSTFARPCHEVAHGTIFWFIWACPKKMEYLNIIIFPDSNCHMTDPYIIHHHTNFFHGNLKHLMVPKWCGPNDHNVMDPEWSPLSPPPVPQGGQCTHGMYSVWPAAQHAAISRRWWARRNKCPATIWVECGFWAKHGEWFNIGL